MLTTCRCVTVCVHLVEMQLLAFFTTVPWDGEIYNNPAAGKTRGNIASVYGPELAEAQAQSDSLESTTPFLHPLAPLGLSLEDNTSRNRGQLTAVK